MIFFQKKGLSRYMDFQKYLLTNQLFINCFVKEFPSCGNFSYFSMLEDIFFHSWDEKLQQNTYRYTVTGSYDIKSLTTFLVQLISFNSSFLFLVSLIQYLDTPRGTDSLPLLLDSAERSIDICNPSYSDVRQFKDSVHIFLELVGQFEAWCVATWEI